jgi:hypothetical protein
MPKKTDTPTPKDTKTPAPAAEAKPKAKAPAQAAPQRPAAAPKATKPHPAPESPTAGNQGGPKVPGVRPMRSRPYYAGAIIAKHGLAAGVTPEMVAELDELYGKVNPAESRFRLCEAWQSARGYLGLAEDAIK